MTPLQAVSAQVPELPDSDDRVYLLDHAVVVLDGASAVDPREVSTGTYVDTLGSLLVHGLADGRCRRLTDVLAAAIEEAAALLDLRRGDSPSSTVAIARANDEALDVLVLGDWQLATPSGAIRDDRLASIATAERAAYRRRLAEGAGYDPQHRDLLRTLQAEQTRHRNKPGGFWIAEADPGAARRAITATITKEKAPWFALMTDGAYRPAEHLRRDDWSAMAGATPHQLQEFLHDLHMWESLTDPHGILLPRAKPHDDKSLVLARRGST
ncbi:hypothetical protein [uncultured Cellulomonas sp.]|uniref:hypothetical protein n=1 Tax=uncultured Cellulomonas sp. TaxID=189682 RepID=UPI002628F2B3|nr:hypothetical protein [uncultured Cellulomonas sp.]